MSTKQSKKTENLLEYTPESCASLIERRKADREKMAAILAAACVAQGATVVRGEPNSLFPRRILLRITGARGMHIGIDFDGDSGQPDIYVCTWNTPTHSTTCFNPDFFGDAVNHVHYHKVTVVAHGFYSLITQITRHLEAGVDGSAFSAEIEAEYNRKTRSGEHLWQRNTRLQTLQTESLGEREPS